MTNRRVLSAVLVILAGCLWNLSHAATIGGIVYEDTNRNSQWDSGEPGIPGVSVSNQKDVVQTDRKGRYRIEIEEETILFVTKPSGYQTPLSKDHLPLFYYAHYPQGSPERKFAGFKPTGPLPPSIDFPLIQAEEPKAFPFYALGDPQPRTSTAVDYLRKDILPELILGPGRFAIALGDIAFNNLSVYADYKKAMAQVGIPIYNVPGNHDMNYDSPDDRHALETFRRTFGPEYYSFDYGQVHFVVLDNIEYRGKKAQESSGYIEKIDPRQIAWLKNDLAPVPKDRLIVLSMHAPLCSYKKTGGIRNLRLLLKALEDRDRVLALAGHTHTTEQHFLGAEFGRRNPHPIHLIVCGALCGSWWNGPKDERGVPVADQSDGCPNGWFLIEVDGNQYRSRFKAAGKDADYQLRIANPDPVSATGRIVVNYFAGSEKSMLICRIDDQPAIAMKQTPMKDPYYVRLTQISAKSVRWTSPRVTGHIWTAPLPKDLNPGLHTIRVEAREPEGDVYRSTKIVRVE